jgi:hypothetical protein
MVFGIRVAIEPTGWSGKSDKRDVAHCAPNLGRVELLRFDIRDRATIAKAAELFERCAFYALARAKVRERVKATRKQNG